MQNVAILLSKFKQSKSLHFSIGITFLLVLVFLYMYFLTMSVVHVVIRKEVIRKTSNMESEIAMLEASYMNSQHKVSDKIAALENFSENDKKIFVSRDPDKLVSYNTTR